MSKLTKILKIESRIGKVLFYLFAFFLVLNLTILVTGKTYIYKGVKETYMKGKKGPGIYDSVVFPTRIAKHDANPEEWMLQDTLFSLSEEADELLKAVRTTSFLIVKDSVIILEKYYDDHTVNTISNTFSMGKSFIGLLIGIAVDEGKIKSLDSQISEYLPFRLKNDEGVTIRDLLGMSSGLDWSESSKNPFSDNAEAYYTSDLYKMMTKKKFTWKPGTQFEYASGNSQLLGIILENATGKSVTDYFDEKIWSKIGTENDLLWSLDREGGVEKTFCCGYATTRDYAKMGQLILNHGKWGENQLISEEILTQIISPYSPTIQHYGLHFWIFNHPNYPAVYFRGILGQYIIVIPSIQVVMVRTGHDRNDVFEIPEDKKNDAEYLKENGYKEWHPSDLFDYYTILKQVLGDN